MSQGVTGVPTKETGNTFTAGEFNSVNNTINNNSSDAESRISALEGIIGSTVTATSLANYSPLATDHTVKADTSSNDVVIDLPAAASSIARVIHIKKMATANKVTLDPNGAELIDGGADFSFFNRFESIAIVSDGTGWIII